MFDFTKHPRLADKAAVEKAIRSIHKTTTGLRPIMHLTLVGCIDHAKATGDTTLLSRFYNGLGNETNKAKGIAIWIKTYTNLRFTQAKDGTEQWLKPKDKPLTIEVGYDATPFYEMPEVEKANKPFNFDAMLEALLDKAMKQQNKGVVKGNSARHLEAILSADKAFKDSLKANASTEIPFDPVNGEATTGTEPVMEAA